MIYRKVWYGDVFVIVFVFYCLRGMFLENYRLLSFNEDYLFLFFYFCRWGIGDRIDFLRDFLKVIGDFVIGWRLS